MSNPMVSSTIRSRSGRVLLVTVAKTVKGLNAKQKAMRHVVIEMDRMGKSEEDILKTVADMKAGKSIDRIYTNLIMELKAELKKKGIL